MGVTIRMSEGWYRLVESDSRGLGMSREPFLPHALRLVLAAIGLMLMPAMSPVALGDETDPNKTFDQVFGESFRRAIATTNSVDDTELAGDLNKAVQTIAMPPALLRVIIEKMTILSEKAPGALLPTVDAMAKLELVETDAAAKVELETKVIAMLERATTAGDAQVRRDAATRLMQRLVPLAERQLKDRKFDLAVANFTKAHKIARDQADPQAVLIADRLQVASALLKELTEVDSLEKRLETNPKDGEARKRLIFIHLVTRDDPTAAIWFVGEGVDEKTTRLLPIAAKGATGADAPTLAELGDWYMDWAVAAPVKHRPAMYLRAKDYYQRMLAIHKDADLLAAKAKLTLEQIDKKLTESQEALAAATGTGNPAPGSPAAPTTPTTPTPGTPGTTPRTTPGTPATPATPTSPMPGDRPMGLTVEITGPTITDPERVERLYSQHARLIGREYIKLGDEYSPIHGYDPRYPSSYKELLATTKAKMTETKTIQDGLIRRRIVVPPVPAEAEAVAMVLPSFDVGAYGYLHSVEVVSIVGPEEMIVSNVLLFDTSTLAGATAAQRVEREKLRLRQVQWNQQSSTMRLFGHLTAGLKPGERVGMVGRGRPLQIYIARTEEDTNNLRTTIRPVATLVSKIDSAGIDEKEFDNLIAKRKLTRTDLINIVLEAQRNGGKDTTLNIIKRIEAKGAVLQQP